MAITIGGLWEIASARKWYFRHSKLLLFLVFFVIVVDIGQGIILIEKHSIVGQGIILIEKHSIVECSIISLIFIAFYGKCRHLFPALNARTARA